MGADNKKGFLGDRFEGFSALPSDEAWDKIAAKMDEKPGGLGPKFEGFEHLPNAAVWAGIERSLGPGKSVVYWRWTMVAAVLLLGMGVTAWSLGWFDRNTQLETPLRNVAIADEVECEAGNSQSIAPQLGKHLPLVSGTNSDLNAPFRRNSVFRMPKYGIGNVSGTFGKEDPKESSLDRYEGGWDDLLSEGNAKVTVPEKSAILPADSTVAPAEKPAEPTQSQPTLEYYPEIEIPKGDEAEGGWGLSLGTNLSTGGSLTFADNLAMMEGDFSEGLGSGMMPSFAGDVAVENYSTPVMIGAAVSIPLSKRIFLQPGLNYTLMNSSSSDGELQIRRQYLGVNVNANVMVIQRNRFGAYLQAGGQADAGLSADVKYSGTSGSLANISGLKPGNQVSILAGMGVQYMLTKHLGLYGQAMATHYLYQSRSNLWSQRDLWPVVQVGVKVQL